MFALSYTLSAFHRRKVSTIKSKQLSTMHCSNVIVLLLCTAETVHRLSIKSDLNSSTPVASRSKFFATTVNGWESLIVDTNISILVTLGVADSPLCEIKISKLSKQHISETRYY